VVTTSNAQLDTDVFVVGGGPAGLAAALAARQQGFRVTVADVLRPPIDKACGEGLMPDSLAELAKLGVCVNELPHGRFNGIRFRSTQSQVEATFPQGPGLGIRRTILHAAMIAEAERRNIEMRWGVRVGGIRPGAVLVNGRVLRARWIIGADGQNSRVRLWAGLEAGREFERRIALRRHFLTPAPPDHVEIHWGETTQAYVTPVAPNEVCVAVIAKRKLGAFEAELQQLPTLGERLRDAQPSSIVRGALSLSNRLAHVTGPGVALIGDASGCVDAITGEGLALSFRQALALGESLAAADLSLYERAHRKIDVLPQFMRRAMLLLDKHRFIRRRALAAFQARPSLFARMLAVHVGEVPLHRFGAGTLADLGWQILTA
jgi:flavin-dependent dehydrogenase